MRVLFTGASSFTGSWFVAELARSGHEVIAPLLRPASEYSGVRAERVRRVAKDATLLHACPFGSAAFLDRALAAGPFDVLCHHAADVTDYRSPGFDVPGAVARNTHELDAVLESLVKAGCTRVVLTGSVFEPDEGAGSEGLRAFSRYGLSKGLTAQIFRYACEVRQMRLGKFVIPNPFGAFEEPRFTDYLARTWLAGGTASVRTPDYVRDNIHVELLARAYVRFVERLRPEAGFERLGPSGYVSSQGEFAARVAHQMEPRLGVPCALELLPQKTFEEPRIRINTDVADPESLGFDEHGAWDELADWYRSRHGAAS